MDTNAIAFEDRAYPILLAQSPRPPGTLYCAGNAEALQGECVSFVGSRRMSAYGKEVVRRLIPPLVQAGIAVVSGLAYGIDAEAHRVALHCGGTCVVVLGSGLDRIYPASHLGLLNSILQAGGCAISEYPAGTPAKPYHFPERNRIVAGLSRATVVVEANGKSGTLITARHALDAGRDVFAVPGDITREGSEGTVRLLSQGAAPVFNAGDILQSYGRLLLPVAVSELRPALTGSAATIYDLVSRDVASLEQLTLRSGYPVASVQSILTVLELDGYVYLNGTSWQKTS